MLTVNSPAPDFEVQIAGGARTPLTDLAGPDGLLIYLMRTATCPVCQAHVRSLVRDPIGGPGLPLLVAVPEDAATAAAWAARRTVGALVVTGVGGSVHEWAGFARKALGAMQQSGTVLLDGAGVVRHVHAATLPLAALDRRSLERALAGKAA